ncbi:MAG TPA: N-6 DNA methylase [Flavisolibacter sp.]|nr:N-6 DNA methylase [Flavisolibacter sp.]
MFTRQDFYIDFDFEALVDLETTVVSTELEELSHLGADKVYLSGDQPAILFKEVNDFHDASILKDVARTHHLSWNYRKVIFLFVLSKTEVRIYNCSKRPFNYENSSLKLDEELQKLEIIRSDYDNLKVLKTIKEVFSRVAVDCGVLWISDNPLRDKISLQERLDKYLVRSLLNAAKELKKFELEDDIIHSLLMRSMFIMYLEDKGAAKETNLYKSIMSGASSYLDILDSKVATYQIFKQLEEHFNGNVFPLARSEQRLVTERHLSIIKKCLFDGDLSGVPKLFHDWRLFRFDIIQIEMLSEIYEHFLEEFKEQNKEEAGQYYTPPSLVELILNEKLNVAENTNWQVTIMDPACGSGIFLVEGFKRLVKRWKNAHPNTQIKFAELRSILEKYIYGIEYDRLAIRVTAFSLYLALLEHLNPRTLWIDKRYKFPYLIFDPEDKTLQKQGKNLIRRDTIGEVPADAFGDIDLLVGNPPFGAKITLPSVKNYCIQRDFGQDMVIPFLHKATEFAKNGSIALIFNSKILTNTEGPFQNFRHWFFNNTYVEKIYNFSIFRKTPKTFGGQLFSSAVGPVSVAFYQNNPPQKPSATLEYWAPKSYVKNNLIEGIVIDATDIKFLPREECCKPDTKIWKIAMWGTLEDFRLLKKLEELPKVSTILDQHNILKSVGIRFLDYSTKKPIIDNELARLPYITPEAVQRYYSPSQNFIKLQQGLSEDSETLYRQHYELDITDKIRSINVFRRIGKYKQVYYAPHVLIKSGLSDKKLCASYLDKDCVFNGKVLGLTGNSEDFLKAIAAIINSHISTYYLFLISSSIGIEREEIKPSEIYELPVTFNEGIFQKLAMAMDKIIDAIKDHYPLDIDISDLEKNINEIVAELYSFTPNDRILMEDFLNISMPLLFEGHKSSALKHVTVTENKAYGATVARELNSFLKNETLYVNASVFEITRQVPLNMVKISFAKKKEESTLFGSEAYNEYLTAINEYTLSELAKSIYIQKQIKYYEDDSVFIIKPNQKRFWSRSTAINDAKELINEILKMSPSGR